MKLSILIPTLPVRLPKLTKLLDHLNSQIGNRKVEILFLGDTKTRSVGEKRNQLIDLAKGEYITFIDDDDWVSDDYIEDIFTALETGIRPDVVSFTVERTYNGEKPKLMVYDTVTPRPRNVNGQYKLCCNHLCVWRKAVINVKFPNKSLGEDHDWAMSMLDHYQTHRQINKVLYYYRYSSRESETHQVRI